MSVACELLERALLMYYRGDSYFASLHLAGAAEELFGRYLERQDAKSAFNSMRKDGVELVNALSADAMPITTKGMERLMNHGKNRTKHMNETDDEIIDFAPCDEAKEVLDRAVSDYYQLMRYHSLPDTQLVARFNRNRIRS